MIKTISVLENYILAGRMFVVKTLSSDTNDDYFVENHILHIPLALYNT